MQLLQKGKFTLNSGIESNFKIDCDALSNKDIKTVAYLLSNRLEPFGSVLGIASGGLRLAKAIRNYSTGGPLLIVDDVFTTGRSMEYARSGIGKDTNVIGAVIFARNTPPDWIKALFICQ